MHPFGLVTLLQFLGEHGIPSLFIMALCLPVLLSVLFLCRRDQSSEDAPTTLPHFSLSHILPSLKRRHDFFAWGFKVTNQRLYQFRILRTKVVVVSGEQGRKDFFSANALDVKAGFRFFSGELPILYGLTVDRQRLIARIYKSLSDVQRHERMAELIPEILDDGQRLLQLWGTAGSLDPFDKIAELIFQATVRCLTSTELAGDPKVVARYRKYFNQAERLTPAVVLFPWFPSPSMVMRSWATKQMYDIIVWAIKVRKESGIPQNDALQMLLDSGEEHFTIVGFMMGFVLAGARATGTAASWLVTYLGCHPNWRNEARVEIKKLIASYSLETSECKSSSSALSSIPLSAWENETPVLDMLVRESVRLSQPFVSFRRNAGPEMYIDGKVIPTGTLVAYPAADVHLDPDLYPDPWKFDPARPQPKGNLTYLSWGVGRTTCVGMRLARLNTKLITALLLMDFDFDTVDAGGQIVDSNSAPKPNWNDPLGVRPIEGQFSLKYTRLDNPESRVAGRQESSPL